MNEVELERMIVRIIGDNSLYLSSLVQSMSATTSFESGIKSSTNAIGAFYNQVQMYSSQVTAGLNAMLGTTSVVTSLFKSIKLSSEMEQTQIAFTTLLQSADQAKELISQLVKFADLTPFEPDEVVKASRVLLAFGTGAKDIIPTMTKLGDLASGLHTPLNDLVLIYAKMKNMGKVYLHDLNQFGERGINIWDELAKETGKNIEQLREMVHHGQVSFPMVEKALNNLTKAGGMFAGGMEAQSKSLGGLYSTLKGYFDGVLREVGILITETLYLKQVVDYVGQAFAKAQDYIKGLSPEAKAIFSAVTIAVAGLLTLIPLWTVLGSTITASFSTIFTVLRLFMGPIGWLIGAAGLVANSWAESLGGWSNLWILVQYHAKEYWYYIEDKFNSFISWVTPIWIAFVSLANTVWEEVKAIVVDVWTVIVESVQENIEFITGLFGAIADENGITWDTVRNAIRDALIFAEFYIKHFSEFMQLSWLQSQLAFEQFVNDITYFFTDEIPAVVEWLGEAIIQTFTNSLENSLILFKNFGENIIAIFTNLPGLIAGTTKWDDIWKPLTTGMKDLVLADVMLPEREATQAETDLKKRIDKMSEDLGQEWNKFHKEKTDTPFDVTPDEEVFYENEATELGSKVGRDYGGAVAKEIHKLDAVAFGSAEALSRLAAYADSFNKDNSTSGTNKSGNMEANLTASNTGSPDALSKQDKQIDLLAQIRDAVKIGNNDAVQLKAANING